MSKSKVWVHHHTEVHKGCLCYKSVCHEGHVSLWLLVWVQMGWAHANTHLGQQTPGQGKQLCCSWEQKCYFPGGKCNFSMESNSVMLNWGNQVEKKKKPKNSRNGKSFLTIFLSSAKSIYIQPSSGQVFKVNWRNHAGEGEKQFSHKCFNIVLSIPQHPLA